MGYCTYLDFEWTILYMTLEIVNSQFFIPEEVIHWGVQQNYALNSSDFSEMSSERLQEEAPNIPRKSLLPPKFDDVAYNSFTETTTKSAIIVVCIKRQGQ
jgi:hypothetical protein